MPTLRESQLLIGKYGKVVQDVTGNWYLQNNRGCCVAMKYYNYYSDSLVLSDINKRMWYQVRYLEANRAD